MKNRKKRYIAALAVILAVGFGTGVIAKDIFNRYKDNFIHIDTSEFIGKDKAKEIALEKASLKETEVNFLRADLDKENATFVYEVDFRHGFTEYSADIKADDGKLIDWEVDID